MESNKKIKCIGLGASRMVGKDTLFSLLHKLDKRLVRRAFADRLKEYCEVLCMNIYKKSISQLTPFQKEQFRPILIETGKICRNIDIDYWVKEVLNSIDIDEDKILVITDVRFVNEYNYLKRVYGEGFVFINVERNGAPEPTEEEKKHIPELKKLADITFVWDTDPTLETLKEPVKNLYNVLFKLN